MKLLSHQFRRSTLWLMLFVSLLAGLGLAHTGPSPGLFFVLLVLPLLVVRLRRRDWLAIVLVIMLGIGAGWWRGEGFMLKLAQYEALYYQKITISLRATEDGIYDKYKQLAFTAKDIRLTDGTRLTGKIQVGGFGTNAIWQGDEIMATGKLYPGYGAYQGRMSFAKLEVIAHHPTWLSEIRRKFIAGTHSALPEPLAPFVMGILVGQRATLPEEVKEDFRMVGLTHIIAVSGYNLTIILNASQKMFGNRSKRLSTGFSLGLIGVFLVLAGASASIVRAAMVSVLSILAAYYGRSFKPLNLIALAAAITAWASPIYLWSDLSWYLSFLAFFGVMVIAPLVQNRWRERRRNSLIAGVALETICAELMTLPFVLHIFGQMSRVGLLANVLVVTLIPLAMLLGLMSGLAGMFIGSLAGWITWPAIILLNYMLDTAHVLASLPNIFVAGIGLTLGQMLSLYGCIALLTAVLWYKNPRKNDIITDMNLPKTRGLLA